MSEAADLAIEFRCSHCSKRLKAKSKLAGRRMRCPNCATEIRVPSASSSGILPPIQSSDSSSPKLVPDDAIIESNVNLLPDAKPTTESAPPAAPLAKVTNKPRPNSFDVEDLQLESLAIDDLHTRHETSKQIRDEKDAKRRLELAAEKRRGDYGLTNNDVVPIPSAFSGPTDDDYNLLPESNPNSGNGPKLPAIPMMDDQLFADLKQSGSPTTQPSPKAPDRASSPPKKPSSKPANKPAAKAVDPTVSLDDLVPDLDEAAAINNDMAFFDDVVEDKYRTTCPTCGTVQYVGVDAAGSQIKCPDCFSLFKVSPPPKDWKPSKVLARHSQFDPSSPLASDRDTRVVDRYRRQATNDLLEKAEIDLEKEKEDEDRYGTADFDTANFMQRTFGFLRDPVAIGFLFGYGLVFALVFGMVQYGVSHSDEAEFGKGVALFCTVVGPMIGILFGLPMISAALAQLEAAANNQPKVIDWPGFEMFENIGDLLSVATAILMSSIPGFLVGAWLGGGIEGSGRIQITGIMFSTVLLFPVFLLSILDSGNLFQLITKDVARSMKEVAEAWAGYYLKTALFVAVTLMAWYLLLGKGKSATLGAIAGASLPLVVFFLFQQVGSLANLIGEHLSFSFAPAESSDDDSDSGPVDLEDEVRK